MSQLENELEEMVASADVDLVLAMTRIADSLDRVVGGLTVALALLVLIAVCEVVRTGVFA